jgi:hypothetical protein
VKDFNYGLVVPGLGMMGHLDTIFRVETLAAMPDPLPPAIRPLPPMSEWVNVRTLGVKGDGETDDTSAIQAAVNAHPVLYFPSGYYIVRDTILLRPETVLIALHPATTTLDLPDSTPAFQGVGTPKPLVQAPQGGSNIVSGLGFFTGGINPRALSLLWMAGEESLVTTCRSSVAAGLASRRTCGRRSSRRAAAASGMGLIAGVRNIRASGSPAAVEGRSRTSGRPTRMRRAASTCRTRRRPDTCTSCRTSTTSSTRSS